MKRWVRVQMSAIWLDSERRGLPVKSIFKTAAKALCATWFAAGSAAAQNLGLTDPSGSGPIVSAVQWLQGTLLGTVATVVAVIAVACVGLLMLTGRIDWRRGAVVVLGCFILFGAVSIVAGIQSTAAFGG